MTELVSIYFRLGIKLEEGDLSLFKAELSDAVADRPTRLFGQSPEFLVTVEEGTVKAWVKAVGTIAGLIAGYGGLRDGIEFAKSDSQFVYKMVKEIIQTSGVPKQYVLRVEKREAVPGLLRNALAHLDELGYPNTSSAEQERQLNLARRDISRALALSDETERGLVLDEIGREANRILPGLPREALLIEQPVALRPEDFDIERSIGDRATPVLKKVRAERIREKEPMFQVMQSSGGLRLRRR